MIAPLPRPRRRTIRSLYSLKHHLGKYANPRCNLHGRAKTFSRNKNNGDISAAAAAVGFADALFRRVARRFPRVKRLRSPPRTKTARARLLPERRRFHPRGPATLCRLSDRVCVWRGGGGNLPAGEGFR